MNEKGEQANIHHAPKLLDNAILNGRVRIKYIILFKNGNN